MGQPGSARQCPKSQTPLCQQGAGTVSVPRAVPVLSIRWRSQRGQTGHRCHHRATKPECAGQSEMVAQRTPQTRQHPLARASCASLVPSPLTALTWRMAPPAGARWTPRPARARGWSCRAPSPTASAESPSCTAPTATTTCPQKPCPATPPSPATCECPLSPHPLGPPFPPLPSAHAPCAPAGMEKT